MKLCEWLRRCGACRSWSGIHRLPTGHRHHAGLDVLGASLLHDAAHARTRQLGTSQALTLLELGTSQSLTLLELCTSQALTFLELGTSQTLTLLAGAARPVRVM